MSVKGGSPPAAIFNAVEEPRRPATAPASPSRARSGTPAPNEVERGSARGMGGAGWAACCRAGDGRPVSPRRGLCCRGSAGPPAGEADASVRVAPLFSSAERAGDEGTAATDPGRAAPKASRASCAACPARVIATDCRAASTPPAADRLNPDAAPPLAPAPPPASSPKDASSEDDAPASIPADNPTPALRSSPARKPTSTPAERDKASPPNESPRQASASRPMRAANSGALSPASDGALRLPPSPPEGAPGNPGRAIPGSGVPPCWLAIGPVDPNWYFGSCSLIERLTLARKGVPSEAKWSKSMETLSTIPVTSKSPPLKLQLGRGLLLISLTLGQDVLLDDEGLSREPSAVARWCPRRRCRKSNPGKGSRNWTRCIAAPVDRASDCLRSGWRSGAAAKTG